MLLCACVLSLEFGLVHRYFFQHNSKNVSSVWENRWTITQSPPYTQPHVLWELADSRLEERRTLQLAGVIQRHPPAIVRHSRNGISRCCGAFTRAYASHCHFLFLTTKKPSVHFAVKLSLAVFALQLRKFIRLALISEVVVDIRKRFVVVDLQFVPWY